tara:strand:- start:250 stop:732 length:483 start_codon:yes stop_codon:yes gene_type:complete
MEFQNTIAYGNFIASGGFFPLDEGGEEFKPFSGSQFLPTAQVSKNIVVGATDTFKVKVKQIGVYFVDFSFIAFGGESRVYALQPFVNNVAYNSSNGTGMIIKFYQQPSNQKYEVSVNGIFLLNRDDLLEYRLQVNTVSEPELQILGVKMNIYNLNQRGIH